MEKERCIYCGTEIDWLDSNNPYDSGLHDIKDKYSEDSEGSLCCGNCNIITTVNRHLKGIIDEPERFDFYMAMIQTELEEYKKDKDKLIPYYIEARRNRPRRYF